MHRRSLVVTVSAAVLFAACTTGGDEVEQVPTDPGSTTPTASAPADDAPLFVDATPAVFERGTTWTNKAELADIDGDGDVDILFADGGDYDTPGKQVRSRVFVNDGDAGFTDVSEQVLGDAVGTARVIKARDVNDDGRVDIVVGNTFETQTRLYLGRGDLTFEDVTATHLPKDAASVGDIEAGDVDGDGDLDLVLADWGPGSPMESKGSQPSLWLNDGEGRFADASAQIPPDRVMFSWELELVDVDRDWDLDLAVSCKRCDASPLYRNDGDGRFEVNEDSIPPSTNNYDFEPMDVDGDGDLDLITTNDGAEIDLGERILINDGDGRFTDETEDRWTDPDPYGYDDNNIVFLDADDDGDADFLVGSLDGSDRLMVNDGTGRFSTMPLGLPRTAGTLYLAVADLNGDAKLDLVDAQGEADWPEVLYLGDGIAPDTSPPVVSDVEVVDGEIHARIHDRKSPSVASDWREVIVRGDGPDVELRWYGEYLWRSANLDPGTYEVCATDAAGNGICAEPVTLKG